MDTLTEIPMVMMLEHERDFVRVWLMGQTRDERTVKRMARKKVS